MPEQEQVSGSIQGFPRYSIYTTTIVDRFQQGTTCMNIAVLSDTIYVPSVSIAHHQTGCTESISSVIGISGSTSSAIEAMHASTLNFARRKTRILNADSYDLIGRSISSSSMISYIDGFGKGQWKLAKTSC